MKLSTSFLIIIALQFTLVIFSEGTNAYTDTGLFATVLNPTNWLSAPFLLGIFVLITLVTVAGTFVGNFLFGKTDTMLFAGAVALFLMWMVPIASLYNMIYKENLFGAEVITNLSSSCPTLASDLSGNLSVATCSANPDAITSISGNALFAGLITAPLLILALWSLIGWWRSNSEM